MSETESLWPFGEDREIEDRCGQFARALADGAARPRLEDYLNGIELARQPWLVERLVALEVECRRGRGEEPVFAEYLCRFPREAAALERIFVEGGPKPEREEKTALNLAEEHLTRQRKFPMLDPLTNPSVRLPAGESPVQASRSWWPVLPDYEILGELGQGGMGVVYKARQKSPNRFVALKMVAGTVLTSHQRARFQAEADAIARLHHPNIVTIFGTGQHKGQPFFALELVEGGTLRDCIDAGPMPMPEAVRILEAVARAIHFAHENRIIHRDLKPGNILLTGDGTPKVTDFGVAKWQDGGQQTRTGAIIGTPEYMAPEQAGGFPSEVGPAADIYSLGVILYECLTSRRPIEGDHLMHTVERVLSREPDSLRRHLPPGSHPGKANDLEAICHKCLEKEPYRRYHSAEALADDLQRWTEGRPVEARPISTLGRFGRWCRRKPLAASLALMSSLLLLTLAGAAPTLFVSLRRTEASRELAEEAESEAHRQAASARAQERMASRQVARLSAATGARFIDEGDYFRALVWTADALQREAALADEPHEGGPREEVLRLRIAGLLDACPRLVHRMRMHDWADSILPGEDGQTVFALNANRTRRLCWSIVKDAEVPLALSRGPADEDSIFSPDGRTLLSRSPDGSLLFRDAESRREPLTLEQLPAEAAVKSLKFWTCDAKLQRLFALFDSGRSGAGMLGWQWSLANGQRLHQAPLEFKSWDAESSAQFSGGGSRLLVAAPHRTGVFGPDGVRLLTPKIPLLNAAVLCPEGKIAAGSDGLRNLVVWDVEKDSRISWPALAAHTSEVRRLRFDSRGERLVTVSGDTRVRVWHPRTGEPACDWLAHAGAVRDAWFSPDERWLLTVSDEGAAQVWDLLTSQPATPPLRHGAPVMTAAWSSDGRRVFTRGKNGSVRVWDLVRLALPARVLPHQGPVLSVAFSPDGRQLLSGSEDGTARVWDVVSGKEAVPPLRHAAPVTAAVWNGDGTRAATLSERGARVWALPSGQPLSRLLGARLGNNLGVHLLRLAPEGNRVLLGYAERANLFDLTVGRDLISVRHDDNQFLRHMAISPDGKRAATADKGVSIRVWELERGKEPLEFNVEGGVNSLRFLTSTRLAATGSFGLRVWEVTLKQKIMRLPARKDQPAEYHSAHLSADGNWLLTVSQQHSCQVWGVESREVTGPPFQPGGPLRLAAVMPGGRHAITVLAEGQVRLWDTYTGEPLTPARRLGTYIHAAGLSPDGKHLALACHDGRALLWALPERGADHSPVLQRLAHLLAAQRIDPRTETLSPLTPDELRDLFEEMTPVLPGEFAVPAGEVRAWHLEQANDCENAKLWPAVLFHLSRALVIEPDRLDLLARRAAARLRLGQTEAALQDLGELVRREPEEARHRERRGGVHLLAGRWDSALSDFEAAAERDPGNGSLWMRISLLRGRLGETGASRDMYRKGLELGLDLQYRPHFMPNFREDPQAVHGRQKQWRPWLNDLTSLLESLPNGQKESRFAAELRLHWGMALAILGEWDGVEDLARFRAWSAMPAEVERVLTLAAAVRGHALGALEHANAAVKLEDGDGSLWFLQALALKGVGRDDEALSSLNGAIERGADHVSSRLYRALLHLNEHRLKPALDDLDVLIAREQEQNETSLALRARLFAEMKQWPQAAGDYSKAAGRKPIDARIVRNALLCGDEERTRRLTALLRQPARTLENDEPGLRDVLWTASLFPGPHPELAVWLKFLQELPVQRSLPPGDLHRALGAARLRLGETRDALTDLKSALKADDDGGTAWDWYFLALTHRALGQKAESRDSLARARAWRAMQQSGELKNERFRLPVLSWTEDLELELLDREVSGTK